MLQPPKPILSFPTLTIAYPWTTIDIQTDIRVDKRAELVDNLKLADEPAKLVYKPIKLADEPTKLVDELIKSVDELIKLVDNLAGS